MHCVRCYGASPAVTHSKIELFIVLSKFTFLSGCIQRPRPRVKSWACETGINISIWHAARERDSAGNTESDVCYHHVMGWGHQGVHDGDTQEMRGDTQRLSPGVTSAPHGNYGCSLWQWWPGVWPPGAGHMSPDVTPLSRVLCSAQYLTVSPSPTRHSSPWWHLPVTRSSLSEERRAHHNTFHSFRTAYVLAV